MGTYSTDQFLPGCVQRTAGLAVPEEDTVAYTDDTELLFYADAASEWWGVHAVIYLDAPNEDDFVFKFGNVTINGGATAILYDVSAGTILDIENSTNPSIGTHLAFGVDLDDDLLTIEAKIESNAAGNVYFQWAKETNTQEDAVVGGVSWMLAFRLG